MTSEYEEIYSRFLTRVTDYQLAGLRESLATEMMNGWMRTTLSKPYVRRLFAQFEIDDGDETIEYEMKIPVSEDEDKEFVEEMIAIGMVVQWLTPQVNSVLNTAQFFSNADQKFYSQANHLEQLRELLKQNKNELRKIIRDRGYIYNGYIYEN